MLVCPETQAVHSDFGTSNAGHSPVVELVVQWQGLNAGSLTDFNLATFLAATIPVCLCWELISAPQLSGGAGVL